MIIVTKTFLPPQNDCHAILKRAWDMGWITNRGVLVEELKEKLSTYLHIKIGKGDKVAVGAVVTKDVPDYCMVAGVPAVIKKQLKPQL
ncbi:hypothetical protein OS188_13965 [Xanthomarina sp. F1114]|uniref:acyltransferase n=1 Tax=Xanthomarina sp. F1114 TaxID=2996019 RepID=UPI00225E389B|nr:hypothetical protein [Xanthomarina sp. F1114]MCX7549058.1 hypothetical protein [Xanthomarina sp. F1114]